MGRARGYYTTRANLSPTVPRPSLTTPVCKALCEYHRDHPCTLKRLKEWLLKEHRVSLTATEVSKVLKRSSEYLPPQTVKDESDEESESNSESGADQEDEQNDDGSASGTLSDPDESEDMEDEQNDIGPALVTLSDPDVLDCPICLDVLTIPVYQCENGHVTCSSCCSKINEKCPSCSLPMSLSRCRFIEKVLEAASIPCTNRKYGCKDMLKYSNKHVEHDKICLFSPCECPESSCYFKSSSLKLYSHFSRCHGFSREDFSLDQYFSVTLEKGQKNLILGAKGQNIFILNNFSEASGSAIKVIQIAPQHSTVRFSYDIRVRYEEASIVLHSSVESIPKWCADDHPGQKYIPVPHYCIASNGQLHLEIRINSKA